MDQSNAEVSRGSYLHNFRFRAACAHLLDHVVSYCKENVERSVTNALCLATGHSEREIKNPPSKSSLVAAIVAAGVVAVLVVVELAL